MTALAMNDNDDDTGVTTTTTMTRMYEKDIDIIEQRSPKASTQRHTSKHYIELFVILYYIIIMK